MKPDSKQHNESEICLECGLCCKGAIFTRIAFATGEIERLADHPLSQNTYRTETGEEVSPQPCSCLRGTSCSIYSHRPAACSKFRCGILTDVANGNIRKSEAMNRVAEAVRFHRELLNEGKRLGLLKTGNALRHDLGILARKILASDSPGSFSAGEKAFARKACQYVMLLDSWFSKDRLVPEFIQAVSAIDALTIAEPAKSKPVEPE